MHGLRLAREDGPKPAAIFRRSVRPQDAADAAVAVEHVVVVVRPLAARSALGRALERQHGRLFVAGVVALRRRRATRNRDSRSGPR